MTIFLNDYRQLEIYGRKKEKIKSKQDKGFDAEIEAFIHSTKNGSGPPIPISELIDSTLVGFAVHESLNTDTVVFLPEYIKKLGLPKFQ